MTDVDTSYIRLLAPTGTPVQMLALLPGREGIGWYTTQPDEPGKTCYQSECAEIGTAYYLARDGRDWGRRYYCDKHLMKMHGLQIIGHHVWISLA